MNENQQMDYCPEVRGKLLKSFGYPVMAVDLETTGNHPQLHSILEVASMDLLNPSTNFEGFCHISDNKIVSMKDIRKNQWGRQENFGKVVNPQGNYHPLLDISRAQGFHTSESYFLQPNDAGDYEMKNFMKLSQIAKGVLKHKKPVEGFVRESAEDLLRAHYAWIRNSGENGLIGHYRTHDDKPVIVSAGQNVAGFDVHYLNHNLAELKLGSIRELVFHRKGGEARVSDFVPWQFQYRGSVDISSELRSFIRYNVNPEDAADFWNSSRTAKGQRVPYPYIMGGPGESLDAAIEFVGLPKRPNPLLTSKPHVAFDDVKLTVEVLARLYTGKPYLQEFSKHEVGPLVTREYVKDEMRRRLENARS